MPKYDKWARWFIAQCYSRSIPYDEFAVMAEHVLGLQVPLATYEMQKTYLKHRSPAQMADEPVSSMGGLGEE
jgi:hypothetical protein